MAEWIMSSCMVILAVLALRAGLGKRISAKLRYALWALVLVRLLLPVQLFASPLAGLQVNYSVPEVLREESLYVLPVQSAPAAELPNVTASEDGTVFDGNSFGYTRLEDGGQTLRRYAVRISPLELLQWLWMAGALVWAAVILASNLRFAARMRRVRKPLEGAGGPLPVYVTEGLPSPCLFGLFRPAVYLTPQAAESPAMLRHVKTHELTHYRHLDHLWSALRGLALAVHWWNPLVWLAVVLSRRDGEAACDEGAIRQLGDGERLAYGETLLALVTAKAGPRDLLSCATTMTGGKRSLRERIRRIACKQKTLVSTSVAAVLSLCVIVVCAFGQKSEELPASDTGPDLDALPYTTDLNRDGTPEQLLRHLVSDTPREFELLVRQGEERLWSATMDETHAGCNTYFLYREGGLDYLLEYLPKMQQGQCTYAYRLFHLEDGEEVTDRENRVEFDINFDTPDHQFDPAAIAAFMEEVNALIGQSELLVNTNHWMLHLEETEDGRLYDDILSALNHPGEDLHGLPLREALEVYARQSADHPDDTNSPLGNLLAELETEDISAIDGDVEAGELVRLLREAAPNRGSRFHESAWFGEEDAWTWSTAELTASIRDGGTLYLLSCDSGNVELAYETAEGCTSAFYESAALHALIREAGRAYLQEELPDTADLDHDGSPDRLTLRSDAPGGGTVWLLECACGDGVWSGYANTSHAGWNALFLCRRDGQDYLLQYNPYMGSGMCSYQYKLFYLEEGGEVVVQEREILFDLMFVPEFSDIHQFDPKEIAAFMEEINGLLENSTQLLNTDGILLGTFEREGRLFDSLWFLDDDGFQRDESKSLLENLIVYQNACMRQAAIPSVSEVLSSLRAENIRVMYFGGANVSDSPDKYLVAETLNDLAESVAYPEGVQGEFDRSHALVGYIQNSEEDQYTILLEIGEIEEAENLVRITCEGTATYLFYSENPENDAFYLRDEPYRVTGYVEDETLYRMVYCDDLLWNE